MAESNKINIKIKHMSDTVHDIEVDPKGTVLDVKNLLQQKTNIPAGEQKLIFKGKLA